MDRLNFIAISLESTEKSKLNVRRFRVELSHAKGIEKRERLFYELYVTRNHVRI